MIGNKTVGALALFAVLSGSLAADEQAAQTCKASLANALLLAKTDESVCVALAGFSNCMEAISSTWASNGNFSAAASIYQQQLNTHPSCRQEAVKDPVVSTFDSNLHFQVDHDKDVTFFRTRRESVSIWDMNNATSELKQDVAALREETATAVDRCAEKIATGMESAVNVLVKTIPPPDFSSVEDMISTLSSKIDKAAQDRGEIKTTIQREISSITASSRGYTDTEVGKVESRVASLERDLAAKSSKLAAIINCNNDGKLYSDKEGKCGDAAGGIKTQATAQSCGSSNNGQIRFNTNSKVLEFCVDTKWDRISKQPKGSLGNPHGGTCRTLLQDSPGLADGVYHFSVPGKAARPAYCDMKNGGWMLVMNLAPGTTFKFGSSYWTSDNILGTCLQPETGKNEKHWAFNDMPHTQFRLVTPSNYVNLKSSSSKTLLSRFKGGYNGAELLTRLAGADKPSTLYGHSYATCGHPWRLNTKTGCCSMSARIGGPVWHHWGCNYGNDARGQPHSASIGGIGLQDHTWSPRSMDDTSAGIRQAHDYSPQVRVWTQLYIA